MLHDIVKKGSVDRSVKVTVIDSIDGTRETGVAYNTAGIDLWYRREGGAVVSITEVDLASLATAHTDGGFKHIKDGECRLDLPDAAFAAGANYVDFGGSFTGMIVIGGRVRLVDFDLEDAVRGGLTALPNAAAAANGGLPTVDATNSVKIQSYLKKNTAIPNFPFKMTDSTTHAPAPLKTVTVTRKLDNGSYTGGTIGAVTEVDNGAYRVDIPAADLNGNVVSLRFTASGCDQLDLSFILVP